MRVALLLPMLAACGDPTELVINSQRDPIIGGARTTVGQFPSVVAVFETKAGALCTGTLISPTVVLTAAHCVDPAELGRTAGEITAETIVLFDTLNVDLPGGNQVNAMNVIENAAHPDFVHQPIDFGHDDDALIVLPAPVTDRLTTPVDLGTDNKLGTVVTQVGYGINKVHTNQAGVEFYLTGKKVVGCAIAGNGIFNASMLCFDEQAGKGQCNGDSGGPAFDPLGHLIGVVSFGDIGCTTFGADTRPGQTASFILANVPELAAGSCGMDRVCNLSCASDPDCVPVAPYCGDGVTQNTEQCDAGSDNGQPGSGCAADCTAIAPVCGNSIIEAGEDCDNGANNGAAGNMCTAECKAAPPDNGGGGGCCGTSGSPVGMAGMLLVLGLVTRRRSR